MNLPDFKFEKELWDKGVKVVGGCDEVGRGCFAGPVVAGTVVFAQNSNFQFSIFNEFSNELTINDSKKMSQKQREVAGKWIKGNALSFGIGDASVAQINKLGIVKATQIAMRRSVEACEVKIDHLLLDAFYLPRTKNIGKKNQSPIIKGDSKSFSIAAASIIAKVYRDGLMNKIGKKKTFAFYEWHVNKGYGTKTHREAILKHGVTKYHRKQFVETFLRRHNSDT